ncbi:unnamed protein product [Urochloa humidicola]
MGDRGSYGAQRIPRGGGRAGRNGGGFRGDEFQNRGNKSGYWDDRRGNFRGGRSQPSQWRYRETGGHPYQGEEDPQFDLRQNLNHGKEKDVVNSNQEIPRDNEKQSQDESMHSATKDKGHIETKGDKESLEPAGGIEGGRMKEEAKINIIGCSKCGRFGHKTEECFRPVVCKRCKKEGHVPRVCTEVLPWECIAPLCGMAATGQGFHVILDDDTDDNSRDMSNWALITITSGAVTAKQIEGEFKTMAGPNSNWRWYAKRVADNKYQMKFPSAQKVDDLAFFTGMQMRTVPGTTFTVERWNSNAGAKGMISTSWFRILGIPVEKRTEKKACYVGSLVGIPLEVDTANIRRWDYVRVKIGCRDITKVPAVVEGLLDLHFYDFTFQREVPTEGVTNSAGNTWTRNADRSNEDFPSPKKAKWGGQKNAQQGSGYNWQSGAGTSGDAQGRQQANHEVCLKNKEKEGVAPQDRTLENNQKGNKEICLEGTNNLMHVRCEISPDKKKVGDQDKEEECSDEESEDQGLRLNDIVSPGGTRLSFGSFQQHEIRHLWKMKVSDSKTVAINEYGTNMMRLQYDPLAVIEAKLAMRQGKLVPDKEEPMTSKNLETATTQLITQEQKEETLGFSPSPRIGTQGAPVVEVSSQEESTLQDSQVFGKGGDINLSPDWERLADEGATEEEAVGIENNSSRLNLRSDKDMPNEKELKTQLMEVEDQGQVRQSTRLQQQGLGGVKVSEKAELAARKKDLEGLQKPDDKMALEAGAEAMKVTALQFHPRSSTSDDTGMVLLH